MRYADPYEALMAEQNSRHIDQMIALKADRDHWRRLAKMSIPVVALAITVAIGEFFAIVVIWPK